MSAKKKPRKPEAIASKSAPLNSHFVLYSLIYLRSSSTVSGVHGNFVAFFVEDVGRWSIGPFSLPFRFVAWLIKYGSVFQAFVLVKNFAY